jgi:VWFA-related protein
MHAKKTLRWIGMIGLPAILATTIVSGDQGQGTVFRATTNYVSTDVIVRDADGKFVPDLAASEFKVLEDGVPQTVQRFVRSIGGRSFTEVAEVTSAPRMVTEGLILPKARPKADASGRIFIIFIDDKHLQASDTPRVKQALMQIRDELVHENDLVGFVSTGTSGIEISPTYDFGHRRFNEAIDKVMGQGMSINEIVQSAPFESLSGPPGLRHDAHTAFKTAYEMLVQLGQINDRRKSFIYVSSGYTFDPFRDGRYARIQQRYQEMQDTPTEFYDEQGNDINRPINSAYDIDTPLADQNYMQKTEFLESDLISELAHITREARRHNVVFYALDPRGLTGMIPIDVRGQQTYNDWRDYIMTQNNSLRTLSEETGGFAIIQTNDYTKGLQRIDAETSDYYIIGYTSTNPDPFKVRREIKIEVTRPGVKDVIYREFYTIPKTKRPEAPRQPANR